MPVPRLPLVVASALALTACSRPKTAFSGDQAMRYVETQLRFGPRVPNSPAAQRTGDWIIARMKACADTVIVQRFDHVDSAGDTLHLRNIIARFRPQAKDRVLYLTHWDTRPVADQDPNLGNRRLPFPGANDGASGVALLIALGDVLKKTPPVYGVDLLFDDGEDYGDFAKDRDVFLGTRYFATHLPSPDYHPLFGVLFDMIGDRDLDIYQEGTSAQRAPEVVERVWQQAADLGYSKYFIPEARYTISDDHVPLLDAGLRVIDVIDFDYPDGSGDGERNIYHHTMQDTIDKVSAKSLQIVGDVATALVTR